MSSFDFDVIVKNGIVVTASVSACECEYDYHTSTVGTGKVDDQQCVVARLADFMGHDKATA